MPAMIHSGDIIETREGIVGVASEWVEGIWSIMTHKQLFGSHDLSRGIHIDQTVDAVAWVG